MVNICCSEINHKEFGCIWYQWPSISPSIDNAAPAFQMGSLESEGWSCLCERLGKIIVLTFLVTEMGQFTFLSHLGVS